MGDLFAVLDNGGAPASPFVVVEVPCDPRGKGRPRSRVVVPKFKRPFVHVYPDPADVAYEKVIAWRAKAAMRGKQPIPAGQPVAVRIFVLVPIPKSWPKRDRDAAVVGTMFPTSKPDQDNYAKSVCDAFNGIVWADDSQICRSLVVKEYGESPGLLVEVYLLP